jgi:tRNA A37 threonylcarbamoyladenosine synthetase subunit TsaC/SUA5/YrdC
VNGTSSDSSNTAINEIDAIKLLEKNKNLTRTRNQIELLKQLIKKEAILRERLR